MAIMSLPTGQAPRGPHRISMLGRTEFARAKVLLKSKTLVQRKRCPTLWGPEEQECVRIRKLLSP